MPRTPVAGRSRRRWPISAFGPAPKYAENTALQNRIGHLYREHVAPGSRPYQDEADTRAKILARNNLLLAQQSGDGDKLSAAVRDMLAAGFRSTLAGEQSDQRMFRQLPQTDQLSLLGQASPEKFKRYFPRYAKKETIRQWYEEHPPVQHQRAQ